jgi:hypothetical protein
VKEGRILHLVFCLLREELLEDGDEVNCMRILEEGRLLSLLEAWSYLPCLFTRAILLLRGAH